MKAIPTLTTKQLKRFWSKVDKRGPDDCWEWTAGKFTEGYGQFSIGYIKYRASRVSYAISNGGPNDFFVCHSCDNPSCVNPSHLWLGTHQDTLDDCVLKGRSGHKLTKSQVQKILESDGIHREIAKQFDVSERTVHAIKANLAWKHVEGVRKVNPAHGDSQTGVKGVSPYPDGRYQVGIMVKGQRYHLGLYDTVPQAKQALDSWKEEHLT